MFKARWYNNPVIVFILSLVALIFSLYFYIDSFLKVNEAFSKFVESRNLDPKQFLQSETWVFILILSVLVGIIIVCLVIIFIYYQKMIVLYRMQNNFINGFTHELKTPIASLKLFLETFEKHKLSEEDQQKYIGFMKRDIDRLNDNVVQILNLAKIEDKKYQGQMVVTDLAEFFESRREKVIHLLDKCHLVIDHENSATVKIDPLLMEMVFINLLSNAINYNDKSQAEIHISFSRQGRNVTFHFKDNGRGISRKHQGNIFKKFYQAQKEGKGSGLGLFLVSQVAKYHKGSVKVYSEGPGQGATFLFQIPTEVIS
ncbi:MAG: HAMP domain-containing histidine kinase [Oligoflexia bacterium]|nr:HAMP domain-containing histidine kinase [Oligoflexia bacterium]